MTYLRRFIILLVACLLLAGCLQSSSQKKVVLAYKQLSADLPLFVALERGYFAEEGLDVEPRKFASSNLVTEALVKGDVDAAASVASATVYIAESKQPGVIKVFGYNANGVNDNYLSEVLVRPDSPISSIGELRGKKIGTFPGTQGVSFTKIVLENNGVNPEEVSINPIESQLHLQALSSGQVDALFTYEPQGTIGASKNLSKILVAAPFEKEIINPWPSGGFVLSGKFYTEDPVRAAKVIRAFNKAFNYISKNKVSANAYLPKYTGIEENVALKVPVLEYWNACQVDSEKTREQVKIFMENKILEKQLDPDAMLVGKDICG